MKIASRVLLGLFFVFSAGALAAEEAMPQVLVVIREFVKPGKSGAAHDRTEGAFAQAMARAKWPTHYVALSSMSGKPRSLFLTAYDSFDAWQKDEDAMDKNTALSDELDRLNAADSALLDSTDEGVFYYDKDSSYGQHEDLSFDRYMEISTYQVRPGHEAEWDQIVKMVTDAHKKAGTSAHWATYELSYGGSGNLYLILSTDKSMAEIDQGFAEGKQFDAAMGEEGMKKFHELIGSAIESSDSQLFSINPRQSYPPDAWVKAAPEFWKPKPMPSAAKPAATDKKPAQ